MIIQTAPEKPLSAGHKAPFGRSCRVNDGDTCWSIAHGLGMGALRLVEFNYRIQHSSTIPCSVVIQEG